jgi:hypothetical protein
MSEPDWVDLGVAWRSETGPASASHASGLARQARRKGRWMVALVTLELALGLLGLERLVHVIVHRPALRGWAFTMLALLLACQTTLLLVRRGRWRPASLEPLALLRLQASRARAAIVLFWLNVVATLLGGLLSLPFLVQAWARVPHRRFVTPMVVAAIALVVLVGFGVSYLRRQHRTLGATADLTRDLERDSTLGSAP